MDAGLEMVWILFAGGVLYVGACWLAAYASADEQGRMFLSSDERVALTRTEALQRELAENGMPPLSRREIWRRINWIWKSSRFLALQSGRPLPAAAVPILWVAAVLLSLKTLILPRAHDLRVLLGGKEFLYYLVGGRRR